MIASRRLPGLNLAHTELSTVTVTGDDLRFRAHETSALFNEVYAAPLSTRDAVRLTQHTDGWPAGLHLFHQALAALPPSERPTAIAGLDAGASYAREYLARHVLDDLREDLLDFLRKTSVLETLTPRRCDALLGTSDSRHLLMEVERSVSLVRSCQGGASHRVHRVLRTHLLTDLLDDVGDERVGELYRRAGALLQDDGAPAEAARAFARAGDWQALHQVLDSAGRRVVTDHMPAWLGMLPTSEVEAEPWLRLAVAINALREGELDTAHVWAAAAISELDHPDGVALAEAVMRRARTWQEGDLPAGTAWAEQLRATLRRPLPAAAPEGHSPEDALLRSFRLVLAGDLMAGRREIAPCLVAFEHDPASRICAHLLATLLDPRDQSAAHQLADYAEALGMTWLARMARALAAIPDYLTGRCVPRTDPIGAAISDADARHDRWGAAMFTALRCVVLLRIGIADVRGFEGLVDRLRRLDAPVLEAWARSGLALASAAAQVPDAEREAESAQGFARASAVPGAVSVAYAAQAVCTSGPAGVLLDVAEQQAAETGLDVRPWRWLSIDARPEGNPRAAVATSPRPPPVSLGCFGRFHIVVGGEAPLLQNVRPRARDVLRLLAVHAGQPVHRETLVDALWRELDPAAGTHNLQVAVSSLRSVLEPGVPRGASQLLVRDAERYVLALPPGSVWDLAQFDEGLAAADAARSSGDMRAAIGWLSSTMQLYVGDVLPEDGPAEWVVGVRERYRMRAAEAAGLLAELHLSRHEPEAAAAAALRSIEIDSCRDASWRLLLTAYDASGNLAAAQRARKSYAEVLTSLGVVADQASVVAPPRRPGR